MRGVIPALVIQELERRLAEASGTSRPLTDYFHLLAGTSTGGLIALGLTAPADDRPSRPRMDGSSLVGLYRKRGPAIFRRSALHRLTTVDGWIGPKHTAEGLRHALEQELGGPSMSDALRDLVVTAYDMTHLEPYFFKRWRARERTDRDHSMVDAGLATSSAPTYFPSYDLAGRALVDGGVFASNPTIAAIAEALKRRSDEPAGLVPHDLFVVSLGTGEPRPPAGRPGFSQEEVAGWGRLGWVWPRRGGPAIVGALLDGPSDATDHWAHMVLNHETSDGAPEPGALGMGPRLFRLQPRLSRSYALDDASKAALEGLDQEGRRLIAARDAELSEIVRRLLAAGPIPYEARAGTPSGGGGGAR
jgi:hypothetical protein